MNPLLDSLFRGAVTGAEVIYSGTVCGRDGAPKSYRAGVLHFVRSGNFALDVAGEKPHTMEAPALVFFPSESQHRLRAVDAAGFALTCAVASFRDAFHDSVTQSFPPWVVVQLSEQSSLLPAVQAFFAELMQAEAHSQYMASRLCDVAIFGLTRELAGRGELKAGMLAAASDARILACVERIHKEFGSSLNVDTLAETAGMSRSRFVAQFGSLLGISPHQYLLKHRMAIAKQLLQSGLSVKQVAGRVGYQSLSAFVRQFKALAGESPGHWAE